MTDVCHLCKQKVESYQEYLEFPDGNNVHSSCWKCARCMKELSKYCCRDGAYYCVDCANSEPVTYCDVCKKEIEGGQKYRRYVDGREVHQSCVKEEDTIFCGVCGKEIKWEQTTIGDEVENSHKFMRLSDGRNVHHECWRCTKCHVYLVDYYLKNGKEPYCGSCFRSVY